jgi:hypothetical protein
LLTLKCAMFAREDRPVRRGSAARALEASVLELNLCGLRRFGGCGPMPSRCGGHDVRMARVNP